MLTFQDHKTLPAIFLFYFFDPTRWKYTQDQSDASMQREEEETEEFRKESLVITVTVSHTEESPSVSDGPGHPTGGSVPVLPSRRLSVFYITVTHTRKFITSSFICSRQRDSCLLYITTTSASPVRLVHARGSGMSSFVVLAALRPVLSRVKDVFQQLQGRTATNFDITKGIKAS